MNQNSGGNFARELQAAVEAVRQAVRLCRAVQAEMVSGEPLAKADRSPVTVADFGSQALVARWLARTFPADPLVAEEDSADLRRQAGYLQKVTAFVRRFAAEATETAVCGWIDRGRGPTGNRFWTLDPIDGTKGFLRGEQYAVALALVVDGQPQVAVLACPALPVAPPGQEKGVLFAAVRGQGAVAGPLDGGPLHPIRANRTASGHRLVESVESRHGDHARQEAVAAAVGVNLPPLRMDSQAKYGVVARGEASLYLRLPSPSTPDYREKIWDHAAGSLIVQEAGGTVTDMDGRPLDFGQGRTLARNRGVVVTRGGLHQAVLDALGNG